MKTLQKFGFILFLLLGGMVLAGDYFHIPSLMQIVLVAVGVMAWIGGIRAIMSRELIGGIYHSNYRERYTGTSASLIGWMLLLGGTIIILLSLIDLLSPGGANGFLAGLADSPSGIAWILGVAGLMIAVFGVTRILSGSARMHGNFAPYIEWSFRVGGVISVLIGLVMMLLAAGFMFAPELLKSLFEQAVALVKGIILSQ